MEYGAQLFGLFGRYDFCNVDTDYVTVTAPSAGANGQYKVTGQRGLMVLAARAVLTTDSNAANRFISIDYVNSNGVTWVRNPVEVVQIASATSVAYEWNYAWGNSLATANTVNIAPILPLPLDAGMVVQFTVANKQVGDQLASLSLTVLSLPYRLPPQGG